tara:strand:- start:1211 stop:1459 length:249 start_codon:yes stop_codon:yes gene_type:complete
MIILILSFLTIFFILILINFFKRYSRKKRHFTLNKTNLNTWMNLTKKERYDLSKIDSSSYLIQRKSLLDQIRKEYKNISKSK